MDVDSVTLADLISPAGRFRRSVRLDADSGALAQLEGYLPTSRSLEVVRRLQKAMASEDAVRAISITGPYGSGKSSLALFVDALSGNTRDDSYKAALSILKQRDRQLAADWVEARNQFGAPASGLVRAVVTTPQREPISLTVLRAIQRGVHRTRMAAALKARVVDAVERAESATFATPAYSEIKEILQDVTARKPMIMVIDEFGKNLEAFADSGTDGDLYLLQELAEWANQEDGLPLIVMTIQHLAFDNYVSDATSAQRREWSKVQGRFEDVPYFDSGAATRQLIRAALDQSSDAAYRRTRNRHVESVSIEAVGLGAVEVADPDLLADCFPLHPTALAILPELCSRYGQNERTLFSFIASTEPHSVMAFLEAKGLDSVDPWVRLDQVYDYFVASAGTFIGASSDASRWFEVETSIRDAPELSEDQRALLKAIGILNLVAGQAALRASAETLAFATGATEAETKDRLEQLVKSGLVVYREFAQEYRIWRGSDFDIGRALRRARVVSGKKSTARVLGEVLPLEPVVAARHSIVTGTTRAFGRLYADSSTIVPDPDRWRADGRSAKPLAVDGLLIYNVDPHGEPPQLPDPDSGFPIVVVTPKETSHVAKAALEVDALITVRDESDVDPTDSAALKEINERIAYARQVLDHAVAKVFESEASTEWVNARSSVQSASRLNGYLSNVLDVAYGHSPIVLNETVNRAELTSQGARARKTLVAAMLDPKNKELSQLGMEGDGPEVSMYHALLESTGIHSSGEFSRPQARAWTEVWDFVEGRLHFSTESPVSLDGIVTRLGDPPFGLREGPAMVLIMACLIANRSSIAIYEHGSYRPALDPPLSERLMKNPGNFSVKYLSANPGTQRHDAVVALATELQRTFPNLPAASAASRKPTILTVTLALMALASGVGDDFTRRTSMFHSLWDRTIESDRVSQLAAVRDALFEANEPDVLLFESLPSAVGFGNLPASGRGQDSMDRSEIVAFSEAVAESLRVIDQTRSALRREVMGVLLDSARCVDVSELLRRASELEGVDVVTPEVKRFSQLCTMRDMYTDEDAWVSALTESVCGRSFLHWDDESTPRLFRKLSETSADFARVSELVRFRDGRLDGAFRAYQVQATAEDGETLRRIVILPAAAKEEVQMLVDKMIKSLGPLGLSEPREAAGALIASIIEREIDAEGFADPVTIDLRSETS